MSDMFIAVITKNMDGWVIYEFSKKHKPDHKKKKVK